MNWTTEQYLAPPTMTDVTAGMVRRLSRTTWLAWIAVLCLLALLNIGDVNRSAAGIAVAVLAALLSLHSKYSFVLFLSACQTVADPAGFATGGSYDLTLAKVQMIMLLLAAPIILRRLGTDRLAGILWRVGPLVLVYTSIAIMVRHEVPLLFLSACATAVVCAAMVVKTETDWLMLFYSIALGCGMATMGYWCRQLGIDAMSSDSSNDWVNGSYTLLRQASGRSDAPGTAAHLVIFIIGSLALSLVPLGSDALSRKRRRLFVLTALLSLVLGLPSLAETYARLGTAGLVLCLPLLAWQAWIFVSDGRRAEMQPLRLLFVIGAALILGAGLFAFESSITETSRVLLDRADRIAGTEGGGLLSGRLKLWQYHIDIMARSPLVGVTAEEIGSRAADGHGLLAADGGMLEAHNVFLHYGSHGGVVCLTLFLILFLRPVREIWKTANRAGLVFLAFYAATTVGLLTLTYVTWKVFWVQQALLWAFAVKHKRARRGAAVCEPAPDYASLQRAPELWAAQTR